MKTEFESKLKGLGFTYQCFPEGYYILWLNNDVNLTIRVQLMCSEPVNEAEHGSRNGNKLQSIGVFRFRFSKSGYVPDFSIFVFQNTTNEGLEFVIIPTEELKRRAFKGKGKLNDNQKLEIVLWLMPDNNLYDCTDFSLEAEWYFMSKGVNGRMADGTPMDYTEFLNDWNRLLI